MVERRDDGARHRLRRLALLSLSLLLVLELLAGVLTPNGAIAREHGKRKPGRKDVSGQIVGGTAVPQGKYPFMAYIEFDFDGETFFCGGSLLNSTHVLTAAHCATDDDGDALSRTAFTVYLGLTDLNDSEDCAACEYAVSRVAVHPDYDADLTDFDAAILTLSQPVPSQIARPLPLVGANAGALDDPRHALRVPGWGATDPDDDGSAPDVMREAVVNVWATPACVNAYAAEEAFVNPATMLCAAAPGRDSCYGDSGGPLFGVEVTKWEKKVIKRKDRKHKRHREREREREGKHDKRDKHGKKRKREVKWVPAAYAFRQVGIVSWGIGCAEPGLPGIYTRLTNGSIQNFIQAND